MSKLPQFSSKVFFAPMAGISDPALRLICKECGAGLVVTELTSVHAIEAKEFDIKNFIPFCEKERPISVQLFGSDIDKVVRAAKIVEPYFDIIDFNMGCPAPHITQQMAGAALLQKEEHTKKLLKSLVKATKLPVTVKMRAGVNENNKNLFLKIGKIAEMVGVKMLILHPRTVKQGYFGKADWSLIKKLKESVKIPVVGNGDVTTPEEAKKMFETGCDYIMIGRAACKNPFLFTQINDYLETGKYKKISMKDKLDYFFRYMDISKNYDIKFSNIRQQAMHFTKDCVGGKSVRNKISKSKSLKELKEILINFQNLV